VTSCDSFEDDEFLDDGDRHRADPITIEMHFHVDVLESGRKALNMEGRAYPGVSSGRQFGSGMPLKPEDDVDKEILKQIEHEKRWFRAMYPTRPQELKITRPGPKQVTLGVVSP